MNIMKQKRIDKGTIQLSERDLAALRWIADQQIVRFDHLRLLLGRYAYPKEHFMPLSISATRHALDRWERAGLIDHPKKIFAMSPSYVWLSQQASTDYISPYPYEIPQPLRLLHLDRVNAARLYIETPLSNDSPRFDHWQSWLACKRELPLAVQQDLSQHPALPDAEMMIGSAITALAVFDRLPLDLEHVVRDYAAQYSSVWYVVPSHLHSTLQSYLALLSGEQRSTITTIFQETVNETIYHHLWEKDYKRYAL